ncbi:MAG: antirestriction protein ArdA [Thermoguttaceae bacterium]|nr:antirestriction protein ArdA [Thermoguttaceae bacterium]
MQVKAFKENETETFELPVAKGTEPQLQGWTIYDIPCRDGEAYEVPYKYDEEERELSRLAEIPYKIEELNEFLSRWLELDEEERKAAISLYDYTGDWRKALDECCDATLTKVKWLDYEPESFRHRRLGEYLLERLIECGDVNAESIACDYFDYERYGGDVENSGLDGYWCEVYDVWVDYAQ